MIKLELLLDEDYVDDVKTALREIGVRKMNISEVKEYDSEHVHVEGYRGSTYVVDFTKKIKMELLLDGEDLIDRALHILSVINIDAEVLAYEVMKTYQVHRREGK